MVEFDEIITMDVNNGLVETLYYVHNVLGLVLFGVEEELVVQGEGGFGG